MKETLQSTVQEACIPGIMKAAPDIVTTRPRPRKVEGTSE